MLSHVKRFARAVAPQAYDAAVSRYHLRRVRRHARRTDLEASREIAAAFFSSDTATVASGPFKGLRYPADVLAQREDVILGGSFLYPKLLGSYEAEIHPWIEELAAGQTVDTVVDVGCAEGYYAVGLASRLTQAQVYAFDIDEPSQAWCRRLAAENGVGDRVHVAGLCDAAELSRLITARTLVVCDCEGFEQELLDPRHVPDLLVAHVIVEVHDFIRPGLGTLLRERFAATHHVERADAMRRTSWVGGPPALGPEAVRRCCNEGRPDGMYWYRLTPRS